MKILKSNRWSDNAHTSLAQKGIDRRDLAKTLAYNLNSSRPLGGKRARDGVVIVRARDGSKVYFSTNR